MTEEPDVTQSAKDPQNPDTPNLSTPEILPAAASMAAPRARIILFTREMMAVLDYRSPVFFLFVTGGDPAAIF
jgi:hypothetical protein